MTAVATDNLGASQTSAPVSVTVAAAFVSPPKIIPEQGFETSFAGESGVTYHVEYAEKINGPWMFLQEIVGTGDGVPVLDPGALDVARRFYRIVRQ